MKFVREDGVILEARNNLQASAFLQSGLRPVKVELSDDVPEGALDTNPDGSVNEYDVDGSKVGTVDAETVEQMQAEAGEMLQNQESDASVPEKPKRGRKPKEA